MQATKQISARKSTILLLLSVPDARGKPNQPIIGTTRMQKLAFLVQERCQLALKNSTYFHFDFRYEPEKFGPADLNLYQDLDFLRAMKLIVWDISQPWGPTPEPSLASMMAQAAPKSPAMLPEERQEEELSFEYLIGAEPEELLVADAEIEGERQYYITDAGLELILRLRSQSVVRQKDHFEALEKACAEVRQQYADWPLRRLLQYVYDNYKSMTVKSTILDRVRGTG